MALAQTGGTRYLNTALAEVKQTVVASPALVFNIYAQNSGAASFIQFFDALAANVTVGSTTPTFVVPLAATSTNNLSLNCPEGFRTGIVVACTSTSTGNGAPGAAALVTLTYIGGGP